MIEALACNVSGMAARNLLDRAGRGCEVAACIQIGRNCALADCDMPSDTWRNQLIFPVLDLRTNIVEMAKSLVFKEKPHHPSQFRTEMGTCETVHAPEVKLTAAASMSFADAFDGVAVDDDPVLDGTQVAAHDLNVAVPQPVTGGMGEALDGLVWYPGFRCELDHGAFAGCFGKVASLLGFRDLLLLGRDREIDDSASDCRVNPLEIALRVTEFGIATGQLSAVVFAPRPLLVPLP